MSRLIGCCKAFPPALAPTGLINVRVSSLVNGAAS